MRPRVTLALAAVTLAACTTSPSPPTVSWTRLALPAGDTLVLRDLADCGGRRLVAGARQDADGTTHPAAWASTDGRVWRAIPFEPLPTSYYGPREVITSIACSGDRVAMIGATPGGAHGNPRVSTWRSENGRMTENQATFELYGGDRAVDVGRIAAGPGGFAIAGGPCWSAGVCGSTGSGWPLPRRRSRLPGAGTSF